MWITLFLERTLYSFLVQWQLKKKEDGKPREMETQKAQNTTKIVTNTTKIVTKAMTKPFLLVRWLVQPVKNGLPNIVQ